MKILKPHEVSKILNVTVRTLQGWDREGKLKANRTPTSNRRYYTQDQINEYLGKKNRISDDIVIYARVSSNSQKADLLSQVEFLKQYANAKGYIVAEVITDIGSGLNYNRKKWNDLLAGIEEKRISKVIVSHKDRFIRFGYDWFERFVEKSGCEIEVVNNEVTSPQEELIQDLVSVIDCFSCRIYGLRKYKTQIKEDTEIVKKL
jgi:predicted site-specific integrase-resolvase